MRKWFLLLFTALILTVGVGMARAESTVQLFIVICDNQAVVNFNGSMDAGYDLFYQVFAGPGGTGAALTNVRRITVDGTYAVSEVVPYINSQTRTMGATGSARVTIATASSGGTGGTPYTADDINDGCNNPTNATVSSTDTGASGSSATTTTNGSNIRSPFGGFINPAQAAATPVPLVVIGARPLPANLQRSSTPGVIFAECDQYLPGADPGILYDNDNITIFWSWYARTPQQVEDYMAQAIHEVSLNNAPLEGVQVSAITRPGNRSYYVFYMATLGNLSPGGYGVQFKLSFKQQISDGYSTYGPDGETETVSSTCTFRVEKNPNGSPVSYNGMYSIR